jgi:hypothetical protein
MHLMVNSKGSVVVGQERPVFPGTDAVVVSDLHPRVGMGPS